MATTNTLVTRSGTGFTINVTSCNLSTDLTEKDFIVLHNSIPVGNGNYEKTTPTVVTYIGTALPANTQVQVRRKTSASVIQPVQFGEKLNSQLYNKELEKKTRWQEEVDLNGTGAGSLVTLQTPLNEAYGPSWNGDSVYPATRGALFAKFESLGLGAVTVAPLNNPAFTGVPTAPTAVSGANTSQIATTAFVSNAVSSKADTSALTFKADTNNPVFSGNPKAPTQPLTDASTNLATTGFVQSFFGDQLLPYVLVQAKIARNVQDGSSINTPDNLSFSSVQHVGLSSFMLVPGSLTIPGNAGGTYLISVSYPDNSAMGGTNALITTSMTGTNNGTVALGSYRVYGQQSICASFTAIVVLANNATVSLVTTVSVSNAANAYVIESGNLVMYRLGDFF